MVPSKDSQQHFAGFGMTKEWRVFLSAEHADHALSMPCDCRLHWNHGLHPDSAHLDSRINQK